MYYCLRFRSDPGRKFRVRLVHVLSANECRFARFSSFNVHHPAQTEPQCGRVWRGCGDGFPPDALCIIPVPSEDAARCGFFYDRVRGLENFKIPQTFVVGLFCAFILLDFWDG